MDIIYNNRGRVRGWIWLVVIVMVVVQILQLLQPVIFKNYYNQGYDIKQAMMAEARAMRDMAAFGPAVSAEAESIQQNPQNSAPKNMSPMGSGMYQGEDMGGGVIGNGDIGY